MAALRELTTAELLRTGIDAQEAADVAAKLARALADCPQPGPATAAQLAQLWQRVYSTALRPDHPFTLHKLMFETTYQAWDAGKFCRLNADPRLFTASAQALCGCHPHRMILRRKLGPSPCLGPHPRRYGSHKRGQLHEELARLCSVAETEVRCVSGAISKSGRQR